MVKNLSHLLCHPQKHETQNQKFFIRQTSILAESFEGLDSSRAQSTVELQSGTKLAAQGIISKYDILVV